MLSKKYSRVIIALSMVFLFAACKKEIKEDDFQKSTEVLKVLDLQGSGGGILKRPGGGYVMVYEEIANYTSSDIAVAVTDQFGNIIHTNKFGGSKDDKVYDRAIDDNGDVYIVGETFSPELRMDLAFKTINSSDAYLAKINKDGILLWQISYSDTSAGNKGERDDVFRQVHIINNQVYCVGTTQNWQQPFAGFYDKENWLVVFDKDGNKIKQRLLPSVPPGKHSGSQNTQSKKLKGDDLLIKWAFQEINGGERIFDTTCVFMRYNPGTDTVLWVRYYLNGTPEGDLLLFAQSPSGDVLGVNSFFSTLIKIDPNTGNVIESKPSGLNTSSTLSGEAYSGRFHFVDEFIYLIGSYTKGVSYAYGSNVAYGSAKDGRPWMMKLSQNGETIFNKKIEVPDAYFNDMVLNENGHLQLLGGIYKFGSRNHTIFLMTTDKEGNILPTP